MRILIFTDTFLPQVNGVVTYILETSKCLAKRGHKILIFAPKSKENEKFDLGDPNIEVNFVPSVGFPAYKEYKVALPRVIKDYDSIVKFRPDVIHIQSPFSLGLTGLVAAKRLGVPVLATYHTLLPDFIEHYFPIPGLKNAKLLKDITWNLTQYFYNHCDLVLTPSQIMKDVLLGHDIKVNIDVLSNGVDLAVFSPEKEEVKLIMKERFNLGDITIVHSGRISYEKNNEALIKAFSLVKKNTDKNVKFLIIGDGPALIDTKKLAKDLGVENDIIFTGYLSKRFLLPFLKISDIFVTASTMETQGIVILEAMASGLPVIGADKMALPELIKDGVNGYLFKPGDEKELADKMLKLINSKATRKKFSSNSLRLVKNHSIELTIEKLEKTYSGLIEKSAVKK